MPRFVVIEPLGRVSAAFVSSIRALMAAFIIKNAMTADNAATDFSFFAIPIATPMAKRRGRLSNTTEPQALSTVKNEWSKVPSPNIRVRLYASIIVVFVNEPPMPRKRPATGNIAMGSMKDRPIRCKILNVLLSFIFCPPELVSQNDVR